MSKLAIFGGPAAVTIPAPDWPIVEESEIKAVNEVLSSGKWRMSGKVNEFQELFAKFQDTAFGVACSNGTVALEMAFKAFDIGAGDEVIVPPYTFIATATAVLRANAVPIFADLEPDSLNMDADSLEALITERTRAIVPVHFGGLPCDIDKINAIARKHNILVIDDAAHAWGTKWNGQGVGSHTDGATFSFQMTKNITAGEGGIFITNNEEAANMAWSYHHGGRSKDGGWHEHPVLGTNYRMTELQAAILTCQMERLDQHTTRRETAAAVLTQRLESLPGIKTIPRDKRVTRRAWHMYDLFFVPENWEGVSRNRFVDALNAEGVPCSGGYQLPIYRNGFFKEVPEGRKGCPFTCPYRDGPAPVYHELYLPNVERAIKRAVWLHHPLLLGGEKLANQIADAFEKIWENRKELSSN
jgi:dTDP-4-amino-4,6-dideoxygalactose transaminase